MPKKRTYKTLTKAQTTKVTSLTRQGKTQAQIAKTLGIAKQSIATAQRKVKIGKRRPSPFWDQVRATQKASGATWKESRILVYNAPKWGKKRHGERYLTPDERYAAMKAKRAEFMTDKLSLEESAEMRAYGEGIGIGDTPK